MSHKHKQTPDSDPKPLGNESPDPFSPTLPPGSLHEQLNTEDDQDEDEGDEDEDEDDNDDDEEE